MPVPLTHHAPKHPPHDPAIPCPLLSVRPRASTHPRPRDAVHNLPWSITEELLQEHMAAAGQVESVTVMRYQNGRSKGCAIVKYVTPEEAQHAITALNDVEVDGRRLLVREDREGPEGPAPGTKPASPRAPRGGMGGGSASPRGGRGGSRGGARSGGGGGGEGAASPRTRQTPSENAVYVGNLPWSVTWANLKDMFSPYGATYAGACIFTHGAARQLCADAAGGSLPARAFHLLFLSSHITTRPHTLSVSDIKMDKSNRSKGWGIVKFSTLEEAQAAIAGMNGSDCEGRAMEVRLDKGAVTREEGEAY